jgi:hypothetical protein
VRRDKDPLGAGAMDRAETSELGDEWIHATSCADQLNGSRDSCVRDPNQRL